MKPSDEQRAAYKRATFTPAQNGVESATNKLISTTCGWDADNDNPIPAYEHMATVAINAFEQSMGRPATDAERAAVTESTFAAFEYSAGVLAGGNNWGLQNKRAAGVADNTNQKHQIVVDTWLALGQPEYATVAAVLAAEHGLKYKPATVGGIIRRYLAGTD